MNSGFRAQVGRDFWGVLQNIPMSLSEPITDSEKSAFLQFLESSAATYPCKECRPGFEWVKVHLPDFSSKKALLKWVCDWHNAVNAHLNRPQYDCSLLLQTEECPSCKVNLPKKQEYCFLL